MWLNRQQRQRFCILLLYNFCAMTEKQEQFTEKTAEYNAHFGLISDSPLYLILPQC
jgi:hypothetical protein